MNKFILTQAGINASIDTTNRGINLEFTHIALGTAGYTPTGNEEQLKQQVQIEEAKAIRFNKVNKRLEMHTLFPFPSGRTDPFAAHEIGIFVKNDKDPSNPILALIWSSEDKPAAHRAVGSELYFSVAVELKNIDTDNIVVNTPSTDVSMLLKSEFDKYVAKESVKDALEDATDDEEKTFLPSYIMVKNIDKRIDVLEAERKTVKLGKFPKYFAPASSKAPTGYTYKIPSYDNVIAPPTGGSPGQYKFKGGTFYILGQNITLPPYDDTNAQTTFFGLAKPHAAAHDSDHIPRIQDGEKLLFVLEILFKKLDDPDYEITSIALKVIRENEYTEQDLNGNSIISPLQIKLAQFTKKDDDQVISEGELEHVNLLKYAKIDLDASRAHHYKFHPVSNYIIKIINKQANTNMTIETIGDNRFYVDTAINKHIDSKWVGMEDAHSQVHYSHSNKEIVNIFTDTNKELHVSSITKDMPSPIGTILPWHKQLYGNDTPLVLPRGWFECNGQSVRLDNGHNITMPDLNNKKQDYNEGGSFLRGGDKSGVFQNDSFKQHTHPYVDHRSTGLVYGRSGRYMNVGNYSTNSTTGPTGKSETRPVNMSVVWIMRVF